MNKKLSEAPKVGVKIAPWLSVYDATKAVNFYKTAFGAIEIERIEDNSNNVQIAQLLIGEANMWVQVDEHANPKFLDSKLLIRMILIVDDPDAVYKQAIVAGASKITDIHEEYGWRTGRIVDPFGHHWEIGKQLA